jgi:hypothetical protein
MSGEPMRKRPRDEPNPNPNPEPDTNAHGFYVRVPVQGSPPEDSHPGEARRRQAETQNNVTNFPTNFPTLGLKEEIDLINKPCHGDTKLMTILKGTTMDNLTDDRLESILDEVDDATLANELNTANYSEDTALTIACANNLARVVEHLLDQGADPHVQNRLGHTPLFLAFMHVAPVQYPMPIEVLKRLEVPAANQHKRCVLWTATHGSCEAFECGKTYTPQTKQLIDTETSEGGIFFVVPKGMKITRYALPPGYLYCHYTPDPQWEQQAEENLIQAFLKGLDTQGNFDPREVLHQLGENIEGIRGMVRTFEPIVRQGPKSKHLIPKFFRRLKMLRTSDYFTEVAGGAFATPTVFQENDWIYDKFFESDAPEMLRQKKAQFDETQFYSTFLSAAHRLPIQQNFIIRFSNNTPLFEMPIKILFPKGPLVPSSSVAGDLRTNHLSRGEKPPSTALSDVLQELHRDGFTDITIIDTSCFNFSNTEFMSIAWHHAMESVDNFKQFTPGNKLGGARLRNRRHRTRKRCVSRSPQPVNRGSQRRRRRRQSARRHPSRRRQRGAPESSGPMRIF